MNDFTYFIEKVYLLVDLCPLIAVIIGLLFFLSVFNIIILFILWFKFDKLHKRYVDFYFNGE